jgi:formamidopyrimidine-DNA glycosylase
MPAPAFCRQLRGQVIRSLGRRGKYIVAGLSGSGTLLIHLRMTGQFRLAPANLPREKHEHIALELDDGRELRFRDTRKFGRWRLTGDPARFLGHLGPEPLSRGFTAGGFGRILRHRAGMLKPLLLNQGTVAGLGNIYVDEALWEARLHPRRSAATLRAADIRRLHAAIRAVLRRGVRARGTTLGVGWTNFRGLNERSGANQVTLRVFRRTGEPCRRCGTRIERIVVGQRSTHLCPRCQPDAVS